MYNYRKLKTPQEIYNEVLCFCKDIHPAKDVIKHCLQTCDNLFMFHECNLFHNPVDINSDLWKSMINIYMDYSKDSKLPFPDTPVNGPRYQHDETQGIWKDNNRRITYEMPSFFGVKYINDTSDPIANVRLGINPDLMLIKHRMLYDVLYGAIYSIDVKDEQSSPNDSKYNLGHLDNPSIFRFDPEAKSEYRLAFDYISRELIYRFPLDTPAEKIRDAMHLELHVSEIRSQAFKIIKDITSPKFYKKFHFDHERILDKNYIYEYSDKVYNHIIDTCSDIRALSINESGKIERKIFPINLQYESDDSALYYAYLYFRNLPNDDYLHEITYLINASINPISHCLSHTTKYTRLKNITIPYLELEIDMNFNNKNASLIQYDKLEQFIDDNNNLIMALACIDDINGNHYKAYAKRHKEYMLTFIYLYKKIFYREDVKYIHINDLLDLLHLYVRLKKNSVDIPTKSCGYNKDKSYKNVKIDYAMQLIQDEVDCRKTKSNVDSILYMRNIIIETWVSIAMYITLTDISCDLFLKRIRATHLLFHKLLQEIPALTKYEDDDINIKSIIEDILFKKKA